MRYSAVQQDDDIDGDDIAPKGGLFRGILLRRYKRFLADIEVDDGENGVSVLTIHCPNTGAMTGCAEPGSEVWYSESDNPKRKYPHTWEWVQTPEGHRASVNTGRANALVEEAILSGCVPELSGYEVVRREVKYGVENSRIDLLLQQHDNGEPDCFVEVKNVTLLESGQGYFPDAVSTRGQKHLRELIAVRESGQRAVLFYCVSHTGIDSVAAASHIDPGYGELLQQAVDAGVEVLAYGVSIDPSEIRVSRKLVFRATNKKAMISG